MSQPEGYEYLTDAENVASCSEMADNDGLTSKSYNRRVVVFSKRVLDKLKIEEYVRPSDEDVYWAVPFLGKYVEYKGKIVFSWKIRPELAEAMEDLWFDDFYDIRVKRDLKKAEERTLQELFLEVKKHPYIRRTTRPITSEQFVRNPNVSEFAKKCANGICQLCGKVLPFRDSTGRPYLECHHLKPLSDGGTDTLDNVVALCPNCHKRMHVLQCEEDIVILQDRINDFIKRVEEV